jgi:hypothetical protein
MENAEAPHSPFPLSAMPESFFLLPSSLLLSSFLLEEE